MRLIIASVLCIFLLGGIVLGHEQVASQKRCTVYSYFHSPGQGNKLNASDPYENVQLRSIKLWLRGWHSHGFNPQFLTITDAESYDNFTARTKVFASFPTVNSKFYELTCFQRWMAFQAVGGGVLMDFDILPFGSNPLFSQFQVDNCGATDQLISFEELAPMVVFGNGNAVERLISVFASFKIGPDQKHVSDMAIAGHRALYDRFGEPPRQMLHFSHTAFRRFEHSHPSIPLQKPEWISRVVLLHFLNTHSVLVVQPQAIQVVAVKHIDRQYSGLQCPPEFENIYEFLPQTGAVSNRVHNRFNITDSKSILPNFPAVGCRLEHATSLQKSQTNFDFIFIIVDLSCLSILDDTTIRTLEATLDDMYVIPLLTSEPTNNKMILEYTMGTLLQVPEFQVAADESEGCAITVRERTLATLLLTKYQRILEPLEQAEKSIAIFL